MDYNYKFVEQLKSLENREQILQASLDVILQEKNYAEQLTNYIEHLTRPEKILISKCAKVLKILATETAQSLQKQLDKIAKIDQGISDLLKNKILPSIFFDRRLNNYMFIKYYQDPQNSRAPIQEVVETQQKEHSNMTLFEADFAKLEWKVEITLSSIKMRKVVRPLILMIFHTKKGVKKTMYMDINQFSELRKNIALNLKQIHLIESLPIQQ